MTAGQYFPNLIAAHHGSAFYLDSYNLPWRAKEYTQVTIYRNERTKKLLGIVDQVTVTPDDIQQAGQDLDGFVFIDGFADAYFFTPWYRK